MKMPFRPLVVESLVYVIDQGNFCVWTLKSIYEFDYKEKESHSRWMKYLEHRHRDNALGRISSSEMIEA